MVLGNRVLKDICGPKRDHVRVKWRKLHKEGLRDFYSSPNIAVTTRRGIRWAEHVARMWKSRGAYRVLVGKPHGRRALRITTHRWKNTETYLQEIDCEGVDWIDLARDWYK
jgi:hypothetical protein